MTERPSTEQRRRLAVKDRALPPGVMPPVPVSYRCYDFQGCNAGYPVKVCTFDGGHTPSSVDDGTSTGDDGLKAFIPPLAWKFIAQF